ncbi:MAG: hypothetical protein DMF84_20390 [Acidobacteria bacterium]|nr:MAG: hypothetical protein DMF84_20390 [Acidobacteriota bacterium]
MVLTPGTRVGPYEIVSAIGAGGMGEVYCARETRLQRNVAIKVLPAEFATDPERCARFEREAQILASLHHPHIASIFRLEESHGLRAIVMELVEGPTLAQRIAEGPVAVPDALSIALQIAQALGAAHERGIVHRDLKPSNIKIAEDGTVKVLDFGLAKTLSRSGPLEGTQSQTVSAVGTRAGVILGTVAYMSPEQARGEAVDKRTDIWAFGCVLYESLTGRKTFPGATPYDVVAAILTREPDWTALPPGTPPSARRVLRRTLEKDPKRRLRDIGDVRHDLEDVAIEPEPLRPVFNHRWHRLAIAGLLLIGAALIAIWIAWFGRQASRDAPETRFEIQTPTTTDPASFAISPDGRQLAFVANRNGVPQLCVRPLADTVSRWLPGTERAMFPFWAPDGQAIGFFAEAKLKRVDLAGGPPRDLANATGWGGTWNALGDIVYAPLAGGPLMRVDANGGAARPVTRLVSSIGEINHCWPQFLPDGRRFIFMVVGPPERQGVYVASLDGGEASRLIESESPALFAPPATLLLRRQATLVALPFDVTRARVTGEATIVAQSLGGASVPFRGAVAVSANNVLVFRAAGGEPRQRLVWVGRTGSVQGSAGPLDPVWPARPELAPDGRRVALERGIGNLDIWVIDTVTGVQSRLTFNPRIDWAPVWSPDARRIVFVSDRSGPMQFFEKPSNGSGVERSLFSPEIPTMPLAFSPDGQLLLYAAKDPKTGVDLRALPLVGATEPIPVVQTPADEASGQFSPDGRWIAYQSNESGQVQIYVERFPTRGGKWQISAGQGEQPRWRHDGKELFYLRADGYLMAVAIDFQSEGELTAATPVPLFLTRINTTVGGAPWYARPQYAVAPDGRFLVNEVHEAESMPPITIVLNWHAPQAQR